MDSFIYVVWEVRLKYDIVVKILLEVLSTLVATMAIVHREDLYLRPVLFSHLWFLCNWLYHIKNNGNPVFVCLSN
jgi:hypothetical protein